MNWIEDFLVHTEGILSPEIFRKWTGISILAAALERKVWIRVAGVETYPTLFILLVGPPGVGKSQSIWKAQSFIGSLPNHHAAPSSVTAASMVDALDEAKRVVYRPGEVPGVIHFNSIYIASSELSALLPGSAYDNEFMGLLTDLYDGKPYDQKRRTAKLHIKIDKPQVNILAGTQPSYLQNTFPEGAWDQGFASRLIMIYAGELEAVSLFGEVEDEVTEEEKKLKARLKTIGSLYGRMKFSPEAATMIDRWHMRGRPPVPEAPKLISYNSRRTIHALKLSMIASINESDSMLIEARHIEQALDWLFEAEILMPDIFKSMAVTSHSRLLQDTWFFLQRLYVKNKKEPVPAAALIRYISDVTPAHNVPRILDVMERGGLISKKIEKNGDCYIPLAKQVT